MRHSTTNADGKKSLLCIRKISIQESYFRLVRSSTTFCCPVRKSGPFAKIKVHQFTIKTQHHSISCDMLRQPRTSDETIDIIYARNLSSRNQRKCRLAACKLQGEKTFSELLNLHKVVLYQSDDKERKRFKKWIFCDEGECIRSICIQCNVGCIYKFDRALQ